MMERIIGAVIATLWYQEAETAGVPRLPRPVVLVQPG